MATSGSSRYVDAALKLITFPTMRRSRIDQHICLRKAASPGLAVRCSWSAFNRHWWSIRSWRQQFLKLSFISQQKPLVKIQPAPTLWLSHEINIALSAKICRLVLTSLDGSEPRQFGCRKNIPVNRISSRCCAPTEDRRKRT